MIKLQFEPYDAHERVKQKMKRWNLSGNQDVIAREVMRSLQDVSKSCRPCVTGACFRTLWNGWPTSARMRSMPDAFGTQMCAFGCPHAEDRVEHYLVCPYVWRVLKQSPPRGVGLDENSMTLKTMLLADHQTSGVKARIAIACYAISRTVQSVPADPQMKNINSVM
eukprot:11636159-Karenia_brevis.AAC.1